MPELKEAIERRTAELHDKGAAHWGGDWLEANIRACNAMMSCGLRPEEHKDLGTLIAWKMCQWGDMIADRQKPKAEEVDKLRADKERLLGELDRAETALVTLYSELNRLSAVAQAPLSTVGRLLRLNAKRTIAQSLQTHGRVPESTPEAKHEVEECERRLNGSV